MKAAVELATHIIEKEDAIRRSKSPNLIRQFTKSRDRDKNELIYYCRSRGLDLSEVFKQAVKNVANCNK